MDKAKAIRDADLILGLFSSYRHSIRDYEDIILNYSKIISDLRNYAGRWNIVLFSMVVPQPIIFENPNHACQTQQQRERKNTYHKSRSFSIHYKEKSGGIGGKLFQQLIMAKAF